MDINFIFLLMLLGAFTGFFAGLFGIGGGGIMVPALTFLFALRGFDSEQIVHLALGTSMAAIVPTACASVLAHHRHGAVLWSVAIKMAPATLVGTFLATGLAVLLPSAPLAIFFALFMTVVAGQLILDRKPKPHRQLPGFAGLSLAGTSIGAISALVAIGGGSLTVPFLLWCNQSIKQAIGTSAGLGLPIAAMGAAGYMVNGWSAERLPDYSLGFVFWPAVLAMASMSFLTAPLGARLAHQLPVKTLKRGFAVLMLLLAMQMLVTVFS
jgi:uncharacterized membrane protein YfcA